MKLSCVLFAIAVVACSSSKPPPATRDLDLGKLPHAAPVVDAAVAATPDAAPVAPATPSSAASAPAAGGHDFIGEARLLYRVAACGGPPEGRLDGMSGDAAKLARIVERHCKNIHDRMKTFRAAYLERHRAWFDNVVPDDVPRTVVYPFGGGDLMSAMVVFPDATEITTISLELAGDPRRLATLPPRALETSLAALRVEIGGLLAVGSNTSKNLSSAQRNELPSQVSSFLIALATAGYEPVSMKYFTLDDAGNVRYLEQADIAALEAKRMKALEGAWHSPNFSEAFAHVEIRYRKVGDDQSETRVHRHFGWNLGDDYLAKHPQLISHLAQKGKVSILTKGGSYLLHRPSFSKIRTYLLAHLAWMLSDSTGIPPTFATPAGMVQETYGSYAGAFLEGSRGTRHDNAFVELWRKQPKRRLTFRFGYLDASGSAHLVVTRPK